LTVVLSFFTWLVEMSQTVWQIIGIG